ncbi:MAG: 1-deoxy-D-xylulose-5-phosphate synthase [Syntrophomonadaceae bacterium]|nr:1-deoxy-D-xylulose-5-phosphate synthase [Bacillota bacterium]
MQLLSMVNEPRDLKKMSVAELGQLAGELRSFLLETVAQNGGHLASNLGVVELTIALHTVFNSPEDKIIWDVGHQSYVHKLLTGRRETFDTLRRFRGLSGFPKRRESVHDVYETGHSSTSVSAALGMAKARDLHGRKHRVIAVIGDGAIGGGLAFEALNHAGHAGTDLLVILNDNEMSIGQNVGGMAAYLGRLRTDPKYFRVKEDVEEILRKIPAIGERMVKSAERLKDALKYLLVPGMIFEELGFTYLGPVNGHQLEALLAVLRSVRSMKGPIVIHVLTKKGKGFDFTEGSPDVYHGVGPFNPGEPVSLRRSGNPTYTEVFGATVTAAAAADRKIVAITAAMASGTGLEQFAKTYPDRFFDVGIAEQHAVTFAAGLAAGGHRPVVAVYSTFLQRAYDQILHDVCLQQLPVLFALDRAGVVGEDGETHHGLFDLAYLRHIPNMSIIAPRDENMLRHALFTGFAYDGPLAVRYPRDKGRGLPPEEPRCLPWGRGELLRKGEDVAILAVGTAVSLALESAERLSRLGLSAAVVDPVFVKPLDEFLLREVAGSVRYGMLTVEEHTLPGGFGSAALELLTGSGMLSRPLLRLGVPDRFVGHGAREILLAEVGLTAEAIVSACLQLAGEKKGDGP